jgi:uncharacterized protein YbjT (DUF2867 family)
VVKPAIAILGAGGLIGHALALDLQQRGFRVRGLARRFTSAQAARLSDPVTTLLVSLPQADIGRLLASADIVVNCIGVLQGSDADAVHRDFTARLARYCAGDRLLIHISVPGAEKDDATDFSRSKRAGEHAIAQADGPYVILRPGFVVADAAFGGSALMRAMAMLPVRLPPRESSAPFAATALTDLCETVAQIAARWRAGEQDWQARWDVMEDAPTGTVGDVIEAFRALLGGPRPLLALPGLLLASGVWAGDAVALLGWRPPVRSTAIAEMRRGVAGDPAPWMAATGITPCSAKAAIGATPATVQERWFARLYLLKALALVVLVLFWCASGLIALTAAFVPARAILLAHGFSFSVAHAVTILSSVMDIIVGLMIALRATSRIGLIAGVLVSMGYMAGAAVFTPDLWAEPLGALVKTGPAIVLMLVCLALSDNR